MKIRDVKIVVCRRCSGSGFLCEATGDESMYREIECPECKGMRVLERVVTIEYNVLKDARESKKEHSPVEYTQVCSR